MEPSVLDRGFAFAGLDTPSILSFARGENRLELIALLSLP